VGTLWTAAMVDAVNSTTYIVFADGNFAQLTARVSFTSLTASESQSVYLQAYTLYFETKIDVFTSTTSMTGFPAPQTALSAQAYNILAYHTPFSTTSQQYVSIVSTSPGVGNFLVKFTGVAAAGFSSTQGWCAIFVNGEMSPSSKKEFFPTSTAPKYGICTSALVTLVSASDIVDARVFSSSSSRAITVYERAIQCIQVQ